MPLKSKLRVRRPDSGKDATEKPLRWTTPLKDAKVEINGAVHKLQVLRQFAKVSSPDGPITFYVISLPPQATTRVAIASKIGIGRSTPVAPLHWVSFQDTGEASRYVERLARQRYPFDRPQLGRGLGKKIQ